MVGDYVLQRLLLRSFAYSYYASAQLQHFFQATGPFSRDWRTWCHKLVFLSGVQIEYYTNRFSVRPIFLFLYMQAAAQWLFRRFRSNPCIVYMISCLQACKLIISRLDFGDFLNTQHADIPHFLSTSCRMSVPSPSHYLFADGIFLLIFSGSDPDMHLHDVYVYIQTHSRGLQFSPHESCMVHKSQPSSPLIVVTIRIILSPNRCTL